MCNWHEQDFRARKTRIWIQAVKWVRIVMEAALQLPDPPSQPRHSYSPLLRGLVAKASQFPPGHSHGWGPKLHLSQNGPGLMQGFKAQYFLQGPFLWLPQCSTSAFAPSCFLTVYQGLLQRALPSKLAMCKRPPQHLRYFLVGLFLQDESQPVCVLSRCS